MLRKHRTKVFQGLQEAVLLRSAKPRSIENLKKIIVYLLFIKYLDLVGPTFGAHCVYTQPGS